MGTPRNKEKIRELVTTVVAFSNTKGGCVYVGIDDECGLTDITHELQKWAQQDRADPIKRYCGALRNAIRGKIEGDLSMQVSHATVDGALVIIVNVDQSPSKPVMVTDDNLLYVRVGSNNKQLPPTQWASVLGPSASGGLPPPGFGN
jgi:predicted HTH transcriptional regulator